MPPKLVARRRWGVSCGEEHEGTSALAVLAVGRQRVWRADEAMTQTRGVKEVQTLSQLPSGCLEG